MGQIKVTKNVGGIEGLCIIEPAVHGDERGYFMETYNQQDMEEAGFHIDFVQDNQSMSTKGVLRGLHFQKHYPHHAMDTHDAEEILQQIGYVKTLVGNFSLRSLESEKAARLNVRRSIVALKDIPKGEIVTRAMVTFKRPGTGISPLPLYADTNTIGTSLQVARGLKLIQSVNDRLGIDGGIQVLANRPGNTTLLHVTFWGTNPQLIKKYSDTYQGALLDTLNTFINEKTIIDMQKANLQTPNPLSREELLARISLSRAQIVKEGAIPTARVDEGYTKKRCMESFWVLLLVSVMVS